MDEIVRVIIFTRMATRALDAFVHPQAARSLRLSGTLTTGTTVQGWPAALVTIRVKAVDTFALIIIVVVSPLIAPVTSFPATSSLLVKVDQPRFRCLLLAGMAHAERRKVLVSVAMQVRVYRMLAVLHIDAEGFGGGLPSLLSPCLGRR